MRNILAALALVTLLAGCGHTGKFVPGAMNVANLDENGKLYFTQIDIHGSSSAPSSNGSLSTFNPFAKR